MLQKKIGKIYRKLADVTKPRFVRLRPVYNELEDMVYFEYGDAWIPVLAFYDTGEDLIVEITAVGEKTLEYHAYKPHGDRHLFIPAYAKLVINPGTKLVITPVPRELLAIAFNKEHVRIAFPLLEYMIV